MSGSTVLLTGATGFLGKVVLEHLLRRREELGVTRVAVLVRARDDAAARERLRTEVLRAPCFAALAPEAHAAVDALAGDVAQPDCGLGEPARQQLAAAVTHVIHCAASIDFDLPLAEATAINVGGSLRVQEMARGFPGLEALVCVSTAYVTPATTDVCAVREELPALPLPAAELLAAIESGALCERDLLARTGHPNTYTLTKSLAEHLLVERRGDLPLAIVRPSIISATVREPFPGWIDSHAAFAGFVALAGLGHLRAVAARPQTRLDVVPADVVAQRIAVTAFERPPARGGPVLIRHAVAGLARSVTIADCRHAIERYFGRHPVGAGPRLFHVGPRGAAFRAAEWLGHRVPARAAEAWFLLARDDRKRQATRRLRERLLHLNRVFPYFTHQTFAFETGDALEDGFVADGYLDVVCAGVHRYLLRQDPGENTFAGRELRAPLSDVLAAVRRRGDARLAHRITAVSLAKILRRATSRVTCDVPSFEQALGQRRPGERLVILPTHRSYLDFLLLPYVFFAREELGVPLPHIAADEMFARIPVLGRIARGCGAFFLQRGRGGEDKALTRAIHDLVEEDRTILFFLEGARSRTRAFLPPRRGLLRALQSTGRAFLLLPVAISYDRIAEEASFAAELEGASRARIRLDDLAGWLTRLRRGEVDLGRVHVACGDALRLDLGADVGALAERVLAELQAALVATTFHLRSFLAHYPLDGVDVAWLADAIRARGGRVLASGLDAPVPAVIERTLRAHWAHHLLRPGGDEGDPRLHAVRAALGGEI